MVEARLRKVRDIRRMAMLALISLASPCAAQVGVPSPQDILENNLNALRGPTPGALPRVGPATPQQQLDRNIDSLRSPGPPRNAPTEQYYPTAPARSTTAHPGADSLLSPTGVVTTPSSGGRPRKPRKPHRKIPPPDR